MRNIFNKARNYACHLEQQGKITAKDNKRAELDYLAGAIGEQKRIIEICQGVIRRHQQRFGHTPTEDFAKSILLEIQDEIYNSPKTVEDFILSTECGITYVEQRVSDLVIDGFDLSRKSIAGRTFKNCKFKNCNLFRINMHAAVFQNCTFEDCNLDYANAEASEFIGTTFTMCSCSSADFAFSKFTDTIFTNCYTDYMRVDQTNFSGDIVNPAVPMDCPETGSFIGWKKVFADFDFKKGFLVELEIPEDARRSSALGSKCRCDKAKVLSITNIYTGEKVSEVVSSYYACKYTVGETVYPDSFDENRWNECTHGIHFFMNDSEALHYDGA